MTHGAGTDTKVVENEQRLRVRYPHASRAFCQCGVGVLDQVWWMGQTRDLSGGGVGLVLPCSFALGTEVTVEVENVGRTFSHTAHARVIHTRRQPNGAWLLGCAFAQEMSPLEVAELL